MGRESNEPYLLIEFESAKILTLAPILLEIFMNFYYPLPSIMGKKFVLPFILTTYPY